MKRSITSSVLVFVLTALVGTALNVRAEAKTDQSAPRIDVSTYWAQ